MQSKIPTALTTGYGTMGQFSHFAKTIILTAGMLSVISNAAADCRGNMVPTTSGPCINKELIRISRYDALPRVILVKLWMLDNWAIHPPLKLPYLITEQLAVESVWGLRAGESIIGDPRWSKHNGQPELEAIALLRNREMAMSSRHERGQLTRTP